MSITHDKIKLVGLDFLETILDIELEIIPNKHGKMIIKGYGSPDTLEFIEGKSFGKIVSLKSDDNMIFTGVITEINTLIDHEVDTVEVIVLTGTYLLDTERKSRSFQDVSMTYREVVKEVLKDTSGALAICPIGNVPIGKPLIQYLETDWDFISRIASHFQSPIVADATRAEPSIWFGLNQNGEKIGFNTTRYWVGRSEKYYQEAGMMNGYTPLDFSYYKVQSVQNHRVADKTFVKGVEYKICEKYGKLTLSEMLFTYTLGKDSLVSVMKRYNDTFTGCALLGTVEHTDRETVKIKLDIDGPNGKAEYPYHWTPTTGNLMYAMPRVGTRVSLILPDHDECNAQATNSPRTNGSDPFCAEEPIHPEMEDYNERAFTTEHGKKMYLYPEVMGFIATGAAVPLHFQLLDNEHMLFESHKEIMIIAEGSIKLEAKSIRFSSPININVVRTAAAEMQPWIAPIGSMVEGTVVSAAETPADLAEYEGEDGMLEGTLLVLQHRFDVLGKLGILQGWEYTPNPRFKDAPQKGEFSIARSVFRAVVVGMVVATVATAVVLTGGAALVLVAGVKVAFVAICKSVAVGSYMAAGVLAISDIRSGNNSSYRDFFKVSITGAITGAVGGIVGGKIACVLGPKIASLLGKKLQWTGKKLSPLAEKVVDRASKAIVGGATGFASGGASGFVTGATGELMSQIFAGNGINARDIWSSAFSSARNGAFFGCLMGAVSGAFRADPVNAVYGFVSFNVTDFEYPGVIPIKWERSWSSKNVLIGSFGYGSGFSYGIHVIAEENQVSFVDKHGYGLFFTPLEPGTETIHRMGKLTLSYNGTKYEAFHHEERLFYTFEQKLATAKYHLTQIETETREHKICLEYDSVANLAKIIDTAGRVFLVTANGSGQISEVSLNSKILARYDYDEYSNLVKVIDVNKNNAEMFYDNHLLIKRKTLKGDFFYWEYIGEGQSAKCIHAWGDNGLLDYTFEYSEGQTIVTNSLGHKEIFQYTPEPTGLCLNKVTVGGAETTYIHNEYSEVINVTNPDGESTSYGYNCFGQTTEITAPSGASHKLEYNSKGQLIKETTPLNAVSEWKHDDAGRTTKSTDPNGIETKYTYSQNGILIEAETNENITKLDYDDHYNLTCITYPNGAEEKYVYDLEGNCVESISPLGAEEKMKYDAANRLVEHTSADGNITNLKYNAYTDIIWLKDNEREISFKYSTLGSIISRREQHRTINFTYDTEEQLVGIKNEANEEYSFFFDQHGNVVEEIGYDDVRKLYSYTPAGKIKGIKRGNTADWIRMKYDSSGYLSKIIYDDGSDSPDEEIFTHGKAGELLKAENSQSALEFECDHLGNVIKEIQNGHEITSSYSKEHAFTRTKLTTSLDLEMDISLNKYGQAEEIKAGPWQAKQTYNQVGQLASRTISAQMEIQDSWSYDNLGRPASQTLSINKRESNHRQYTWGMGDKLKSIIDSLANIGLEYSYDKFGDLESEKATGKIKGQTIRSFDDTGQVFETRSKIDRKYAKGGQLLVSKHCRYTYNDCGDLIEKREPDGKVWKFEYYISGLMSRVVRPDGKEVTFGYDSIGRRISKTFQGKTTKYLWDGDTIIHEYIEQSNLDEANPQATTWLYEDGSFIPIAKLTSDAAYSIVTDHIGTPTAMLDHYASRVWDTTFDIWGREHQQAQSKNVGGATIVTTKPKERNEAGVLPFRYQGQYEDMETGIYYNRFRYYLPNEGIYTQRDPIGLVGGNPTVYGYVWNSLIDLDPLGLVNRNSNNAMGNNMLYIIYSDDTPNAEILKIGQANADDIMADGTVRRMNTSQRHARRSHPNATARPYRDLGYTNTGKARRVEAKVVRTLRNQGHDLPLNKERTRRYQANSRPRRAKKSPVTC